MVGGLLVGDGRNSSVDPPPPEHAPQSSASARDENARASCSFRCAMLSEPAEIGIRAAGKQVFRGSGLTINWDCSSL